MRTLQNAHVQGFYRPLIAVFIIIVIGLIVGVVYAGWSSATITITPRLITAEANFPITIGEPEKDEAVVSGTITDEEKSATITVLPTGQGDPQPAYATGSITIKNATTKEQPLSAGTRLQATNGVIFRTKNRVDVPANGSVSVTVTADVLGETGNVEPGKFIIVALWAGLQDKIFGQSIAKMTGGLATSGSALSLEELTSASKQAEEKIRQNSGTSRPGIFVNLEPTSVITSPKPEISSASYDVTVTMKQTIVNYRQQDMTDTIRQELLKTLPTDQEIITIDNPTISIDDRPSTKRILLHIESSATAQIKKQSALFQPITYVGLSLDQIKKKLSDTTKIKSIDVHLSPVWRTMTPSQPQRISVLLRPAQL